MQLLHRDGPIFQSPGDVGRWTETRGASCYGIGRDKQLFIPGSHLNYLLERSAEWKMARNFEVMALDGSCFSDFIALIFFFFSLLN